MIVVLLLSLQDEQFASVTGEQMKLPQTEMQRSSGAHDVFVQDVSDSEHNTCSTIITTPVGRQSNNITSHSYISLPNNQLYSSKNFDNGIKPGSTHKRHTQTYTHKQQKLDSV